MKQTADRSNLPREPSALPPLDLRLLALIVGVKLVLHLATAGRYGYFRDELYFLDLGRHLDWGYVDCAPMVALYAKLALLLGGSLPVLRTIAAIAGAAKVAVTMVLARELGGRRYAQLLAGLCALLAPIFLAADTLMTMNGFEPLFWMGCVWALIRIVRTGDSRYWIAFGVFAGLGLENKHSMERRTPVAQGRDRRLRRRRGGSLRPRDSADSAAGKTARLPEAARRGAS